MTYGGGGMVLVLRLATLQFFSLRVRLLVFSLTIICVLCLYGYTYSTDLRYCFTDSNSESLEYNDGRLPQRLEDVLQAQFKPPPGRSIFFHETSCRQPPRSIIRSLSSTGDSNDATVPFTTLPLLHLTPRQACAVESAALHNPNLSIFVLFASPVYHYNTTTDHPVTAAIRSYPNVHLRNVNLWTYAIDTPIHEWFQSGKLFRSSYMLSHISDFLRYLTLWRFGGIYMDMDTVTLRSMEDVPPNYTGAESERSCAAGVMSFAHNGFGHELAEACLLEFECSFNGKDWGNNGPGVITRVLQRVCGTKSIALMTRERCMGFHVFPRDAFYAVHWTNWTHFFEEKHLKLTMEKIKYSYVAHVWNKFSAIQPIKFGLNVAYDHLAKEHCPKVYNAPKEYF